MALVLSRGIIVLGIYIYTVSVTTASLGCPDLFLRCYNTFQQMDETPLCGELRDAINCGNTSDIAMCLFSAVNHTLETETYQSNQHVNSNSEAYQSLSEPHQSSEIQQSKRENNGNDVTINTNTRHLDSGSHSELDGTFYGNSASQSDQVMWTEEPHIDFMRTVIDLIEDAKVEYQQNCTVRNAGHSASPITWSAVVVLIGVFATVEM